MASDGHTRPRQEVKASGGWMQMHRGQTGGCSWWWTSPLLVTGSWDEGGPEGDRPGEKSQGSSVPCCCEACSQAPQCPADPGQEDFAGSGSGSRSGWVSRGSLGPASVACKAAAMRRHTSELRAHPDPRRLSHSPASASTWEWGSVLRVPRPRGGGSDSVTRR